MSNVLETADPELYASIGRELNRQRNNIELIASENFVSPAVLAAAGSILTNKYAEGLPAHRYYGGCRYIDEVEQLAIDRAKALFGCDHVNVQPHSGANANSAVFFALLEPGDTYLGMSLANGGHLSHGSPVNISGKYFHVVPYGLTEDTETIDYDQVERLAREHRPKLILAGASAYSRTIDFARFRAIADEVGALLMVDIAHIAGLIVAGEHPSPVPYADVVTTTTHKTLRGPRGGMILCREKYAKAIDKAVFPGMQGGPLEHIIAAKAVALREAATPEFRAYQHRIVRNAKAMSERFLQNGIRLVSGGTDNHLMLLNLIGTGVTGKEAETLLDACNITVNKNTVPNEPLSPFVTSGIRIGTPAATTRGLGEPEMVRIADCITDVIRRKEQAIPAVKETVASITARFPLYPEL